MAWPKLRNRKQPASLVTMRERGGTAAQAQHGAAGADRNGVPTVRHATPSDTPVPSAPSVPSATPAPGPSAWPGVVLPAQRADGPNDAPDQPSGNRDIPFWDWAPSDDAEDTRFPLDENPGGGSAYGSGRDAAPVVRAVEDGEIPPRKEGIGHRLGSLDHIFGDTRMGAWRRRAVIAIVVGLVFTILLNWRIGLTLAVIVAIADTIYRSRKVPPAPPGVRLTRAQKQTQRQLAKLERSGYRALHSRLIPGSGDHIDHLVIGPAGVFSIDSEAWDKKLPVRTKNARQLWHGPFSQKERLEHARWESERAAECITSHADRQLLDSLPGRSVSVRPAMAVYGPKIPWDIATIRDVDVFSGGRLRTYLRRYARQNHSRPLSPAQVEQIFRAAHAAFPNHEAGVPAASPFAGERRSSSHG